MSRLEITLSVILAISVAINIGLILYVRAAIAQLLSVSEELGDLQTMIDSFTRHIMSVYELDMFYGDETLKNLMEHASDLNKTMENFEYIYSLTDPQRNKEVEYEPRRIEDDETEEEEIEKAE